MPTSRYNSREMFINSNTNYRKTFFEDRGVKQIEQYSTGRFLALTPTQRNSLTNIPVTWSTNMRLHNLAHQYYGDAEYWWVIALYNYKSSVFEFREGEIINIPKPLELVLNYMGL